MPGQDQTGPAGRGFGRGRGMGRGFGTRTTTPLPHETQLEALKAQGSGFELQLKALTEKLESE